MNFFYMIWEKVHWRKKKFIRQINKFFLKQISLTYLVVLKKSMPLLAFENNFKIPPPVYFVQTALRFVVKSLKMPSTKIFFHLVNFTDSLKFVTNTVIFLRISKISLTSFNFKTIINYIFSDSIINLCSIF